MSPTSPSETFAETPDTDLARRTFQGTWGHPATVIIVYFTTSLPSANSGVFWVAAAAIIFLVLLRIPLLTAKRSRSGFKIKGWRISMAVNIIASGAVWGFLTAYTCAFYGSQSRNSTLLVLYGMAIAAAGVNLLMQSMPLVITYLLVLFGPFAYVAVQQGNQGVWLAVTACFYFIYLLSQARRLHAQYWQQLKDNQQLSIRAHRDSLTGLFNRSAFQDSLGLAVSSARTNKTSVALLYIDLDDFKEINDRLSHRIGDLFLREIAGRLNSCCIERIVPFRLGGDEFTVLLEEGMTMEAASAFALRLQSKFQEPMLLDGNRLTASASIGLSMFPNDCIDEEDLIRTADHAMYAAKGAGKGSHCTFRDARRTPRFSSDDLAGDIREALLRTQFEVFYQPQVDSYGTLGGFEALLRWTHPTSGNIPPLNFIPLAETTGLIVPIGFWILRQVCKQGVNWHREGCAPVSIAVNVSPVQLENPGFVTMLMTILRETGYPPSLLTLEITESMLVVNEEATIAQLKQIRGLGLKIAIDDFGTGYSSLSRIDTMPVDLIKLDRTFISAIRNSADRAPIVEAILAMARALDIEVIAEGIELPEQYDALCRMGCEMFQGFYFGKAANAESARDFCSKDFADEVPADLTSLVALIP